MWKTLITTAKKKCLELLKVYMGRHVPNHLVYELERS